ncbi:T9SS C-terminal target domain-containing protein [bacterium]|nr:MAG: T9SS C-terminal target domain-containing protein [bacterium]
MKIFRLLILGTVLIFGIATANAQVCEFDYPDELYLYDSYCIHVCAIPFNPQGFFIVGNWTSNENNFPVLIFADGCSPLNTNCLEDCAPFEVPTGEWVQGLDPYNIMNDPDYYYLGNDCIGMYMKYAHGNPATWDFFFAMYPGMGCEGCFCITFDSELPVNLLDFTAVAGDGEVALNWNTASESNTDHFEIVRNSELLEQVPARNAVTGSSYSWVDNSVQNGHSYSYELFSVDFDGTRAFLSTASATPSANTGMVTEYALHQNYPNPFNPETQIAFDLVEDQFVTLKVLNLLGQEVATVASGEFNAGRHTVNFNGADLTSGVYLYTLTMDNFSATKKLVLLK